MATNTIAQAFGSVKTIPEKKEQKNRQYFEGFSQADYDPTRYDMCGQLRSRLVEIIMAGSNEQAFTILSAVDVIDHIPGAGENFVPLKATTALLRARRRILIRHMDRMVWLYQMVGRG